MYIRLVIFIVLVGQVGRQPVEAILALQILRLKYCTFVKIIICIMLYYSWNFENKYSVCLSYLFGHVYSGSQPNRLEPVLEPQAVYVCLSYLFGHVYSGSQPYRLEPV